jgi:anthranilate synthase/aminodeoxychorismate synthase-like glutamine amidotransferase
MILLIDNYDSFTYNLARYLRRLGMCVRVLRNDSLELPVVAEACEAIVISPGPCGPDQAGQSIWAVKQFSGTKPILGICLGHQAIAQAFGGRIIRARKPIHGRALPIHMLSHPLFAGIAPKTGFARYHSLVVEKSSLPDCLRVIATGYSEDSEKSANKLTSKLVSKLTSEGSSEIMALEHRQHPTYGVQFHPESVLSTSGYRLLANFLSISGFGSPHSLPEPDLVLPASISDRE